MNKHLEEHNIIIKSLTEALFFLMDLKPFSEISITELVRRAGVARSTYYKNFSAKEDIIALFFHNIFLEFQSKYPVSSIEERFTEEHISHVLEFLTRYSDKVKIINKSGISSYYLTHLNQYLLSLYSKPNMTSIESFHIYAVAGAEYNLIFNWYLGEQKGRKKAIREFLSIRKTIFKNVPQKSD